MAMSENSKKVITYLQGINGADVTADDVATALDLTKKTVVGCFNASVVKKELGYRDEAQVKDEEGNITTVKFLKLNDAGMAFDVDAQ